MTDGPSEVYDDPWLEEIDQKYFKEETRKYFTKKDWITGETERVDFEGKVAKRTIRRTGDYYIVNGDSKTLEAIDDYLFDLCVEKGEEAIEAAGIVASGPFAGILGILKGGADVAQIRYESTMKQGFPDGVYQNIIVTVDCEIGEYPVYTYGVGYTQRVYYSYTMEYAIGVNRHGDVYCIDLWDTYRQGYTYQTVRWESGYGPQA